MKNSIAYWLWTIVIVIIGWNINPANIIICGFVGFIFAIIFISKNNAEMELAKIEVRKGAYKELKQWVLFLQGLIDDCKREIEYHKMLLENPEKHHISKDCLEGIIEKNQNIIDMEEQSIQKTYLEHKELIDAFGGIEKLRDASVD